MVTKMVKIEKKNCNLKNKKKKSNFEANKDAKCNNEGISLKQSKALQHSKESPIVLSTPTIIIDIAQKYSEKLLFLSDRVGNIFYL